DNDLICNTSIDTMSVIIDEPLDFLDYLLEQGYDVEAATYVPRKWMGGYLSNRFDKYCAIASQSNIDIVHLPYLVNSLKIEGNG
ncbi:FAD/NAD(P)-binding protein, partial [Pseudomonas marginalis]|uniref:FAD/NAD(P)-binding protein n=1 Tax=Pseudomonas marginalis TaxID=298 RepID=UPI002B1E0AA4